VCGAGVASGDVAAWRGVGGGGDDVSGESGVASDHVARVSGVVSLDLAATLPRASSPVAPLRPCIYIDIYHEYIFIFSNDNIK